MTIFEKSRKNRTGYSLPDEDSLEVQIEKAIPEELLRSKDPSLPESSETEVVRHYNNLSKKNFSVDSGFYPLGSCTMKYNPRINESIASLPGFTELHPYQPEKTFKGALELMYDLKKLLSEITGMKSFTLQPAAGAHGELTGMLIIKKYFRSKGEKRNKVIIPDSAHGTNPASAKMVGFDVVEIKSNDNGIVDLEDLKKQIDEDVAGIMLTNPNTLGLFEKDICKITEIAHEKGALMYYDGANLNAIMGKVKPGDMGFDIIHLNLHKTFSTPHGMGGPGSGPVGVAEFLKDYLPVPIVDLDNEKGYYLKWNLNNSIGRVRSFFGNFNVLVKAYSYILMMGKDGLRLASEMAVLNANYLRKKLSTMIPTAFPGICKHEAVFDGSVLVDDYNVKTIDLAKKLLDYNVHPPTIYFPLIVNEALMIEPSETESKENIDNYISIIKEILVEARNDPEKLKKAPYTTPVRRLDEVTASRSPVVSYRQETEG
ncbi:MAG: aminomethyl-transferring glycine dehydrogenase subunit GcvPB [Thermotogota bacterium]|nr:aminomethyl-transferring glycine dehydrogenase subunit GcvPB [Thermotogota bacterium]